MGGGRHGGQAKIEPAEPAGVEADPTVSVESERDRNTDSTDKINNVIDAIIKWNTAQFDSNAIRGFGEQPKAGVN